MIVLCLFSQKKPPENEGFFLPKPEADILMPLVAAHLDALFGAAARRIVELGNAVFASSICEWFHGGCKWFAFGD